jgi:hypothetical protein
MLNISNPDYDGAQDQLRLEGVAACKATSVGAWYPSRLSGNQEFFSVTSVSSADPNVNFAVDQIAYVTAHVSCKQCFHSTQC